MQTGQEFNFVAPGGQTTILYDPPASRGTVGSCPGTACSDPGTTVGLDDFPGQVVVLNIWGSWCGPCRAEAPDLEFVAQQTAADGVSVLGIDVRDDRAAAADFVRDRGLTYDSIFDPPGRTPGGAAGLPAQHRAVDGRARPAAPGRGGVPDPDPRARADPAGAAPGDGRAHLAHAHRGGAPRGVREPSTASVEPDGRTVGPGTYSRQRWTPRPPSRSAARCSRRSPWPCWRAR